MTYRETATRLKVRQIGNLWFVNGFCGGNEIILRTFWIPSPMGDIDRARIPMEFAVNGGIIAVIRLELVLLA